MTKSRCANISLAVPRSILCGAALLAAMTLVAVFPVSAQQPPAPQESRVVVIGEGSVSTAPDFAQITSGVTMRAKTAKEAADANSKVMTAIIAALRDSGVEQKDIQTSRFSVQPVYAQPANAEPKLSGFNVSNQVTVTIR
jgi:hypothetical protein